MLLSSYIRVYADYYYNNIVWRMAWQPEPNDQPRNDNITINVDDFEQPSCMRNAYIAYKPTSNRICLCGLWALLQNFDSNPLKSCVYWSSLILLSLFYPIIIKRNLRRDKYTASYEQRKPEASLTINDLDGAKSGPANSQLEVKMPNDAVLHQIDILNDCRSSWFMNICIVQTLIFLNWKHVSDAIRHGRLIFNQTHDFLTNFAF